MGAVAKAVNLEEFFFYLLRPLVMCSIMKNLEENVG